MTDIGKYAFTGCAALTKITLPEGLTTLGEGAFSHCAGLTDATLPAGLTDIGTWAFSDCSGLTISVIQGSAAETYCKENNLRYKLYTTAPKPITNR